MDIKKYFMTKGLFPLSVT